MNILIGFLIVLEILVSILLTLVILVQPSKSGGGLGGALGGGGMSEQLFGARTGNVLTKATIVLASVFLLNTIGLAVIYSRQDRLISPADLQPQPGMSSAPADSEAAEGPIDALTVEPESSDLPQE